MGTRRKKPRAKSFQLGFTLIELMVVVAIIAILAAIAYPSYASHMRKGRRAEAQAYLMDLAQRQQQYFTDNRSYALDAGGVTAASILRASSGPNSFYTIATASRSVNPSFVITATAIGTQAPDGNLTLDDTGTKSGKWQQ